MTDNKSLIEYVRDYLSEEIDRHNAGEENPIDDDSDDGLIDTVKQAIDAYKGGAR